MSELHNDNKNKLNMKKNALLFTLNTKLLVILFVPLLLSLLSCKKSSDSPDDFILYNIEVKVSDGVSYFYKSTQTTDPITMSANANRPNASFKTSEGFKAEQGVFVSVYSTYRFKDEFFEIIVTHASTGEIAVSKKEKGSVAVAWVASNN